MLRWKSLFGDRLPKGPRRPRRKELRAHRRLAAEPLEDRRMLATVTVTNALNVTNGDTSSIAALMGSDGGDGISLREAIEAANNTANSPAATPDVIEFDIAGAGPHVIDVSSGDGTLPSILDAVTIDGYSQTGASANTADIGSAINATLQIVLDGNNLASPGLTIATAGSGSTIQGLNIRDFNDGGILIASSNSNVVAGNFIGTNETGTAADGNSTGVSVTGNGSDNTIGGTANADRNLISGNSGSGVALQNSATMNTVLGNFIGLQADGTSTLGNGGSGVIMNAPASGNTVGGTTTSARNVIGGNNSGVRLFGVTNTTIVGNYIGVDRTGTGNAGNTGSGVLIEGASSNNTVGGTTVGERNVISGNGIHGIDIDGANTSDNLVQGNFIGTDASGTIGLGNSFDGVVIGTQSTNNSIGGTVAAARNVISGNGRNGVRIFFADTSGNLVQGNFIGTDLTGTLDLGNSTSGVSIESEATDNTIGGTSAEARNVISGNDGHGVHIRDLGTSGNLIQGNFIGTDETGSVILGNSSDGVLVSLGATNNTIGGVSTEARNVISGNDGQGVEIANANTSNNLVQGNFIGVDAAGTTGLGNGLNGVLIYLGATNNTIGGTANGAGNVVSSNGGDGVTLFFTNTSGNMVQGNFIGTDLAGTVDLGNTDNGVNIFSGADDNTIGGTVDGAGNTIAFNEDGVRVLDAEGNRIQQNSIFNNTDLGIDLNGDGLTANDFAPTPDEDEDANRSQNFPIFVGNATLLGNSIAFRYRVPTATANANYPLTIDFYVADSNNQEGQTYLESDTYTFAEAETTKVVVIPAPPVLTNNSFLATATDADGNTSEFSDDVQIALPTILGSEPTLILPSEFININQVNRYQYIAHSTGKTVVRIDFLHLLGDLDLEVRDENGFLLAEGNTSSADQNFEEVILPMVGQETYFINVTAVDFTDDIGQVYALEVENFPAPDPTGVHLDPNSDTGMMNNDGVTADTTPTLYVQTDVLNFVDTNNDGIYSDPDLVGPPEDPRDAIHVLTAAEAQAIEDGTPQANDEDGGIAVEVTLVNTNTNQLFKFFADPLIATIPDVFELTVPTELPDGTYLISARTKVFDGQRNFDDEPDQAMGRSNASPPLWITIDTALDANMVTVDMLAASDSGAFVDDNVTNKMQPAFQGLAPANSKVRLYANGELVGQTVTGSETSDVGISLPEDEDEARSNGLGLWEITSEPLADDFYAITVEVEDAAGNFAEVDPELDIVIDTLAPNTPYLNVVDAYGGLIRNNMPTVTMTTTDPNVDLSQFLFEDNYRFLLYDRYENSPEFLLYDSADDPIAEPQNEANNIFTALELIETMLPNQFFNLVGPNDAVIDVGGVGKLADGVHNFKLEVEDRAGNISDDFIFEITVDTSPLLGTWAAGEVALGPSSGSFANGTAGSYGLLGDAQLIGTDLDYVFAGKFLDDPEANRFRYTVEFTVDGFDNGDPLNLQGSQFEVVFEWDTSGLTPRDTPSGSSIQTNWPDSNTTYELTVSGSGGSGLADGTYFGTGIGSDWIFVDNTDIGGSPFDSISMPAAQFSLPGQTISLFAGAVFDGAFNTPPNPPGTVFPYEFSSGDANGWFPAIQYNDGLSFSNVEDVSGMAERIPTAGSVYDTLAAYGRVYEGGSYTYRWLIDKNGNGYIDPATEIFEDNAGIIGVPVAGNFDEETPGDEVGLFTGTEWYLDTDGDYDLSDESPIPTSGTTNYTGYPIVGDFDGNGHDDLATYNATSTGGNLFSVDTDWDGDADYSFSIGTSFDSGFGFSGTRERPVAADFNADGIDDLGLWVPDGINPVPNELSEWYLLLSGDDPSTAAFETTVLDRILDGPLNGYVPFIPALDVYAQHGNTFALPVVGRFAPRGLVFDSEENGEENGDENGGENGGDNEVTAIVEREDVSLPEQVEALVQLEAPTTVEVDPPVVEEVPATPQEQPPVAKQSSFASQEVVAPEALVETVVVETVEETTPKQQEPAVVPTAIETPPSEEKTVEKTEEEAKTEEETPAETAPVVPIQKTTSRRGFRRSRSARFSRAASTAKPAPLIVESTAVELPAADPAPVAELKTPAETFVVEVPQELPLEPIPALFEKAVVVATPEVEPAVEKPPATSEESDALEAAFAEVTEVELSQPDSEPEEDLAVEQAKVWQQQTTSTSRRRFRRSRSVR